MTVVSVNLKSLSEELNRSIDEIKNALESLGVEVNENSVEILPNRPDLYSYHGIKRILKFWFHIQKPKYYEVKKSGIKMYVDSNLRKIRPWISCTLIKNVNVNESIIYELMDLQEKLHKILARDRKKFAIGVHDFDKLKSDFYYKSVKPNEISFIPLNETKKMYLDEILNIHEKGIAYRHLLINFKKYPIIVDANNNVLSFPPIINNILTKVTQNTKNIFIDVTGLDFYSVDMGLKLITTTISEIKSSAEIYSVDVVYKNKIYVTPDLKFKKFKIHKKYISKLLDIDINSEMLVENFSKVGLNYESKYVYVPPYRFDIISDNDLAEELAIAYGYNIFKGILPEKFTIGSVLEFEIISENLRKLLIGLGFTEVVNLSLSNPKEQFENMLLKDSAITIFNPISEEHTLLRTSLLPNLLTTLKHHQHYSLPQKIFEIGDVIQEYKNIRHLACTIIHSKANFTEMRSVVECILKHIFKSESEWKLEHCEMPFFISGRCAKIISNEKVLGHFGEIHPKVLMNFELKYPVTGFEMCLRELPSGQRR